MINFLLGTIIISFFEKVRITADSEDLDSVKELGGVEIIYRQEA